MQSADLLQVYKRLAEKLRQKPAVTGFRIGNVLRKWTEEWDGIKWYYVEHVRDGKEILSYSNYADPEDSNAA